MAEIRVGTCSWTDKTLLESKTFYPPGLKTAEDRLKFYAQHFNTVEVDSTFYALPARRNAELWAERTPSDFIFHIKAFGLLTQHAVEVARRSRKTFIMFNNCYQDYAIRNASQLAHLVRDLEHYLRQREARVPSP